MVEGELPTGLAERLLKVDAALTYAAIPHAFGGAIALAYWGEPRATYDLDINISLTPEHARRVTADLDTIIPHLDIETMIVTLVTSLQGRRSAPRRRRASRGQWRGCVGAD